MGVGLGLSLGYLRGSKAEPQGQLWVANQDLDMVVAVDHLGRFIGQVPVPNPIGLTFCPDQALVFVGSKKGNQGNPGAVFAIDPATRAVVRTYQLPATEGTLDHPAGLSVHGNTLYVAEQTANAVLAFDIPSGRFVKVVVDLNAYAALGVGQGEAIEQIALSYS